MARWALSRLPKRLKVCLAMAVALPLALYLILFGIEAYSARQASRILDRVEALRLGDSEDKFRAAVQGCRWLVDGSRSSCELRAGAYRLELPWRLLYKLPESFADRLYGILLRAGLRYWQLRISADIRDGRLERIATSLEVVGRAETLGASWQIGEHIPPLYNGDRLSTDERRTYMHWYHISSLPVSGEGFTIDATPSSTEKELTARRVNRGCLLSSRGCDGLCDVLPDAAPVLRERKQDWGGWTSLSPSKCEAVLH